MATKRNAWAVLCGLTHGGSTPVASRNRATEIASDYTDEQVSYLVDGACSVTLVVVLAFANLLDDNVMARGLLTTYQELFPSKP